MTELPEAKQLNHLGIIAGVCKDIGLIDIINKLIKKDEREVSVGAAIQALILNATGFRLRF